MIEDKFHEVVTKDNPEFNTLSGAVILETTNHNKLIDEKIRENC